MSAVARRSGAVRNSTRATSTPRMSTNWITAAHRPPATRPPERPRARALPLETERNGAPPRPASAAAGDDQRAEPDPGDERRDDQAEVNGPRVGHVLVSDAGDRLIAQLPERLELLVGELGRDVLGPQARHRLHQGGVEQRVASVDQVLQRRGIDVDDRPDVVREAGLQPDVAVTLAAEEAADLAER